MYQMLIQFLDRYSSYQEEHLIIQLKYVILSQIILDLIILINPQNRNISSFMIIIGFSIFSVVFVYKLIYSNNIIEFMKKYYPRGVLLYFSKLALNQSNIQFDEDLGILQRMKILSDNDLIDKFDLMSLIDNENRSLYLIDLLCPDEKLYFSKSSRKLIDLYNQINSYFIYLLPLISIYYFELGKYTIFFNSKAVSFFMIPVIIMFVSLVIYKIIPSLADLWWINYLEAKGISNKNKISESMHIFIGH